MKITYVITKGTWGGAQTHLYNLIADQIKRGNDISLIYGESGRLINDLEIDFPQLKLYRIETLSNNLTLNNILGTLKKLRELLKRLDPDIVHLHSTVAGTLGRIASIGLNTKIVFTVHGSSFTPGVGEKRERFAKMIEKMLLPLTDKLIFVSKFDQNLWNDQIKGFRGMHKGIVIYNGVADSKIKNINTSDNMHSNRLEICMAARFSPPKKQKLLIESIKENGLLDKVHVTFLGSGELQEECEKVIGGNSTFSFVGSVSDVSEYYNKADVIALVTKFEGLPISLLEALPLGKPVIASNVGGISEIVSSSNGFCVDNSSSKIAKAITQFIDKPELLKNMGNNSRKIYENYFKISKMLEKTNEIYMEVISK